MMVLLAEGPIRLIYEDGARIAPEASVWWPAWALWAGVAVLVVLAAATLRRRLMRSSDPYDRLLSRLCEATGVTADARTKLLLRAGGDAQRATGMMLLGAIRESERVSS
jgi:hypothetical protein